MAPSIPELVSETERVLEEALPGILASIDAPSLDRIQEHPKMCQQLLLLHTAALIALAHSSGGIVCKGAVGEGILLRLRNAGRNRCNFACGRKHEGAELTEAQMSKFTVQLLAISGGPSGTAGLANTLQGVSVVLNALGRRIARLAHTLERVLCPEMELQLMASIVVKELGTVCDCASPIPVASPASSTVN